jgi:quinol-cytochrome oxidoreductase complex cytochrome b subunit
MAVDYTRQYRSDQLEPFWPNEILKMTVAVLCTLAVIMFLAILPVLLEMIGIHGMGHQEEPADPHGSTPAGIKPEWYFLAVYQYLRLMPTQLLGISGKTLGVLSQGVLVMAIVLLPFWYRRRASVRPGRAYRAGVTAVIVGFLALTIWGGWHEQIVDGEERLIPLTHYVREQPMIFVLTAAALIVFYLLVWQERRAIRRVLDETAPPRTAPQREERP